MKKKLKLEWDFSRYAKIGNTKAEKAEKDAIDKFTKQFEAKWRKDESYLSDPKTLKIALDEYEEWAENYGLVGKYGYMYGLLGTKDMPNALYRQKNREYDEFSSKMQNRVEFFSIKLSKLDVKIQKALLSAPELKKYKHMLERLFLSGKFTLSEDAEKIVNLENANAFAGWIDLTKEMLSKRYKILTEKGKRRRYYFEQLINKVNSDNKTLRKAASEDVTQLLEDLSDIAEHELNNILRYKKIQDELRGYTRPDEARHVSDDIETKVVDNLIKTVSDKFSVVHKYYRFKAQLFGLKKLAYNEKSLSYGQANKKYSYIQATDLVMKVFSNLDKQFADIAERLLTEGNVDVYPKRGKNGGAFCVHGTHKDPIYVLLNFTGELRNVTTIAHEFGHAINDVLMRAQPETYYGTSLATAEVASTFMEDFVNEELMKGVDDEMRLAL